MENINILMDIYFNSRCNDETIAFRQSSINNIKKFILTFPSNEELEYMVDIFSSREKARKYCRSLKNASEMEMEFILYYTDANSSSIMKYLRDLFKKNLITNLEYEKLLNSMSIFCRWLLQERVIEVLYKKYDTVEDKPVRDLACLFTEKLDDFIYIDVHSSLVEDNASEDSSTIEKLSRFIRDNNLNFMSNDLEMYLNSSTSVLLKRMENAKRERPHLKKYLGNLDSMLKKLALNLIKEDTNV